MPALLATAALLMAACSANPPPAPPVLTASPSAQVSAPSVGPSGAATDPTQRLIDGYLFMLQENPQDLETLLLLGLTYIQHARETADPAEYARAEEALSRAQQISPDNAEVIIGLGTLALARHDFEGALALGQTAVELAPRISRGWGVVGDALTELGRYDEAVDAVQTMVDTRPDLSSFSRVSYQRELRGDLDGAIEAMERALEYGSATVENSEYIRVLLGNLWFLKGDLARARSLYQTAYDRYNGFPYAAEGLARVDAAEGRLPEAIARYQEASAQVPQPQFLIGLGEAQEATGNAAGAQDAYTLVRDIQGLYAANGVDTDLDTALFEAEHGSDPDAVVALAQAAYDRTPNVRAADALAWVLYKAGRLDEARTRAEEALRLGSAEPLYLYHAGMIAKAQSDTEAARDWLAAATERNPGFSPLHGPKAVQALSELGAAQ